MAIPSTQDFNASLNDPKSADLKKKVE